MSNNARITLDVEELNGERVVVLCSSTDAQSAEVIMTSATARGLSTALVEAANAIDNSTPDGGLLPLPPAVPAPSNDDLLALRDRVRKRGQYGAHCVATLSEVEALLDELLKLRTARTA